MNINTGKLASGSNLFFKKLKENSSVDLKKKDEKESKISEKLKKDFFDISSNVDNFKSRIISNNAKLSDYENKLSELQFIKSKNDQISDLYNQNELTEIDKIIQNSKYNNRNVLIDFFNTDSDLKSQIDGLYDYIAQQENRLNKDFMAIEIASQNIISMNSINITELDQIGKVTDLDLSSTISSYNIDNSKVLELIK